MEANSYPPSQREGEGMSDQEDKREKLYMKIIDIIVGLAMLVVITIIILQRQTYIFHF